MRIAPGINQSGVWWVARWRVLAVLLALPLLGACSGLSVVHRNQLVGAGLAQGLSMLPNGDLEQTYYLGSFDPQDQVPPAVYRIRVRGQSSVLSAFRFASSWVPAEIVDSLTGSIAISTRDGNLDVRKDGPVEGIATGRGLVLFGPEGFREAPRNHRLVIVMGSSPETVEQAFASALGTVARVRSGESTVAMDRSIIELLSDLGREKQQLRAIQSSTE